MIPKFALEAHLSELTDQHIQELAPMIAGRDLEECNIFGVNAAEALLMGRQQGWAYAMHSPSRHPGDTVIGACGVTDEGVIWSLWRLDLAVGERLAIMRLFPNCVRMLQTKKAGVLFNFVLEQNTRARRWLEASRLFDFGSPVDIGGHSFIPFQTKGAS